MYTYYQQTDSAQSDRGDPSEGDSYALYDAIDVPESFGAWTLKDFADILQDVDDWH
jgi:hypothetical protein